MMSVGMSAGAWTFPDARVRGSAVTSTAGAFECERRASPFRGVDSAASNAASRHARLNVKCRRDRDLQTA